MRVGISIITQANHNIWNNGIGQNVYHLATLIEQIPFVEKVFLINTGDQETHPQSTGSVGARFPLVSLIEAQGLADVAIELSGGIGLEWANRFRARGGKLVFYNCGQPYAALVEPTIFDKPAHYGPPERCDEVWQLPKDARFNAFMRGIYRCPVQTAPYLWAPAFIDEMLPGIVEQGGHFGYVPGALARPIPSIFEPNISPIKMGIIPFMICEAINRADPALIEHLNYLNGTHMASHPTFFHLVSSSSLYTNKKMTITARDFFALVMARGSNMVISHQIDCPQNYAYLDAIYGNYPLIHNSPMFDSVGYYYPDSNVDIGIEQYRTAIAEHDHNLEFHQRRNAAMIESVSPLNRQNRDAYARLLLNLVNPLTKGMRA
jgi:hypothetical protein